MRDGLKPVQRRILYTMWQQNLTADAKHRKCAKVVGDVMGNYHPHGDGALYETLVRMAQSFSLRYPLIDGSGNFGSLDGDSAAAMRYTECRLARISDELLTELDQDTVPFRPNYDGTRTEPVVLPARVPTLLINGAMGIAVGMATNVPPHHLGEVCTALLRLIDNPELTTLQLCKYVKGPDFPTGGQILNSPDELKEIYRSGSGAIRLRGTWEKGEVGRATKVITITAIPYTVDKSELVTRIADLVISRKLPPLLDVRDVSTDDIRVELEIKRDADEALVMAYLCRHTPLQVNLGVNLTCLIPTEQDDIGRPERLDLKAILWHFLHFRMDVVSRRLEHEAAAIARRVHILEGFEQVFDALDQILEIVRKSDGKADAAAKIMHQVRPRRRAGRRDPRAQGLPPRAPRDPHHPARTRRQARAAGGDRRPARGRAGPVGGGAKRDCRSPEAVQRHPRRTDGGRPLPAMTTSSSTTPRHSSSTRTTSSWCRATGGSSGRRRSRTRRRHACARATRSWRRWAGARAPRWCCSPPTASPTPAASSRCPHRPAMASPCSACSSSRTASAWWR